MARNLDFEEPDYTALSDIIDIGDDFDHIVDNSLISHSLSSVAANASLGDTNIAVPGRLLGCVLAYVEAGASEYFLDTDKYGYKLVFTDNISPLKIFVLTISLGCLNLLYFGTNLLGWRSLGALGGLVLNLI